MRVLFKINTLLLRDSSFNIIQIDDGYAIKFEAVLYLKVNTCN